MMKESIFNSKKRVITACPRKLPPYVIKNFSNRGDLIKEKTILEELREHAFVPNIIWAAGNELKEEYISGKQIDWRSITKQQLRTIADHLKELHSVSVTERLKCLFKEKRASYDPLIVFHQIESERPTCAQNFTYYQLLLRLVTNFRPKRALALIHGDLNATNFVIDNSGNIYLIDWIESRIDYPLLDLANLAFQGSLTQKQKKILLTKYGCLEGEDRDLDILILLNAFFEHTSPYGNQIYAEKIAKRLVEKSNLTA